MEAKGDIAVAKFLDGYNCAQSVLYSFSNALQIDTNTALKIACGFGAGMGRRQEVCGAVTGGIIALGAKYGRGMNDDRQATELTYAKTRELMERFSQKHGTFVCRKLLNGCELTMEEGQKHFKENDYLNTICVPCVRSVVEILDDIMQLAHQ
jgi:C_GCAxxG_C_C family probable redox protein